MKIFKFFTGSLLVLVGIFVAGPRVDQSTSLQPVNLPADLDQYVKDVESQFADITPGTERNIVWAGEKNFRTDFAVVYVHGYTATRQEIAPVPQMIASRLQANLYNERLTGHGRPGDFLREASVNQWINDSNEAIEIGRRLGKKVVLIGVSTGATLLTHLLNLPQFQDMHAAIFISPNYLPKDPSAKALLLPWSEYYVELIVGEYRDWTDSAQNDQQRKFWTTRYPSVSLRDMMGAVNVVTKSELDGITVPIFGIVHKDDNVINPEVALQTFERIKKAPVKTLVLTEKTGHKNDHVIAGDALSPENNQMVTDQVIQFLNDLK